MHQNRWRLGLHPTPYWGSLQRSPRPPSWIQGVLLPRLLLLRGGKGGEGRERRGREGRGGVGRVCLVLNLPLATPLPPPLLHVTTLTNVYGHRETPIRDVCVTTGIERLTPVGLKFDTQRVRQTVSLPSSREQRICPHQITSYITVLGAMRPFPM